MRIARGIADGPRQLLPARQLCPTGQSKSCCLSAWINELWSVARTLRSLVWIPGKVAITPPAACDEFGDFIMGIFDALNTAVAGLKSQSYALQNISGNIANASTIGYKGINTTFEDLVAQSSSPTSQVAGGVQSFSQQTLTTAGTGTASTVANNMAINGDGFFSVQNPPNHVGD